jgi:anti-anti-sigma regulatory factor
MSNYRFFTVEASDDTVVARAVDPYLQGPMLAELIKLELMQIIESAPGKNLVIDFQDVKLVSSSVISSLLGIKRHVTAAKCSMKLCSMTVSLRHVFKTLNMDGTVFEICDTIDEALRSGHRGTSYYDIVGQLSPPDEENP